MTVQSIDEGQTLRVRCEVQSNPPAKISWYTPDKNMYMTGPELVLQAVTQSDAGIYVCQAKTTFYNQNQVTDTREVQVFVKCKSIVQSLVSIVHYSTVHIVYSHDKKECD